MSRWGKAWVETGKSTEAQGLNNLLYAAGKQKRPCLWQGGRKAEALVTSVLGTLQAHCGASRPIYTHECTNTAHTCIQHTQRERNVLTIHTRSHAHKCPSEHTHIAHINALATYTQHTQGDIKSLLEIQGIN